MATYTVTTSADEDAALEHHAQGEDQAVYFDMQVHTMLGGLVDVHHANTAPAPAQDVANAYLAAPPDTQQQVVDLLGV